MRRLSIPVFGLLILFNCFFIRLAISCTTVAVPSEENAIGKNFDWNYGHGLLMVNKRNVEKRSLIFKSKNKSFKWTSQFGSLTFNQHGREFPLEGINEEGLIVQVLWMSETIYPEPSVKLESLNELQWIQYILDTARDLDTAVEQSKKVKIESIYAPVHYFACDIGGQCGSFEYLNGELVIHRGNDLPVPTLANNSYENSLKYLQTFEGFGGTRELPLAGEPFLDRFVTASYGATTYNSTQTQIVPFLFSLLNNVASFGFTKWQSVYLPKKQMLLYRTASNSTIRKVQLNEFDLSCKIPVMIFNLENVGEKIGSQFQEYSVKLNKDVIDKNTFLDKKTREGLSSYPALYTQCAE